MFSPIGSDSIPSFNPVEESQPNDRTSIRFASEEWRYDRDLVLAAVRQNRNTVLADIYNPVEPESEQKFTVQFLSKEEKQNVLNLILPKRYEKAVKRFEREQNTIPLGALKI